MRIGDRSKLQKVVREKDGSSFLLKGYLDEGRFTGPADDPLYAKALPTLQTEGYTIVQIVPADPDGWVRYLLEK